jgi:hypothetical protein
MSVAGGSTTNASLIAAKSSSRPLQHRGHHVASLLAYRQPETLAEQLLAVQEHNNELQEQLVCPIAVCYGAWKHQAALRLAAVCTERKLVSYALEFHA